MSKIKLKAAINKNVLLDKSKVAAIAILNKNRNFVHDEFHINSVEKNVLKICEGEKISPMDIFYLRLSSHWHDTGRVDLDETEVIAHENISVQKFQKWAWENNVDKTIVNKVIPIILRHRNRKARKKTIDKPSTILWDADKLDIINVVRCNRILLTYENGINNNKSEYNFHETLNFWKNIGDDFVDSFYTQTGKILFMNRFPSYKKLLEKYMIKSLNMYNKK